MISEVEDTDSRWVLQQREKFYYNQYFIKYKI